MILERGSVLLGLRARHRRICPGLWDFFGGHLEPGETSRAALVRELIEEIGVSPLDPRPLAVIDFSAEAARPLAYRLYRVTRLSGEPRLANSEHSELKWWPIEEAARLDQLASEKHRPFLAAEAVRTGGT